MRTFTVKITQTREGFAEIEAETEVQALQIAAYRYQRLGEELPDMEDGLPLKFSINDEMSLTAKIQSAGARAKEMPTDPDHICKVTFLRTAPGSGPYQFDVSLDEIPKMYAHDKDVDVFLDADSRIKAYEKASKVVGEDVLSDYVIAFAEIVPAKNIEHHYEPER